MKLKDFLKNFTPDGKIELEDRQCGGLEYNGPAKNVPARYKDWIVKDLFYCEEDLPGFIGISVAPEEN